MSIQVVAAGFIIFRKIQNSIEYLLLQTSYGENHWTPPKGHVDPGESEIETAWRETMEEAGLSNKDLKLVDNFQKTLTYEVNGKPKRVEYWLTELLDPNRTITLSHEHINFKWLQLTDAREYSKYPDMQEAFKEADDFISKSQS